MLNLIDTHCHLHDQEWFTATQQSEFLANARQQGIRKIICIGTDNSDSLNARDFAIKYENVYWTYGVHPEFANQNPTIDTGPSLEATQAERLVAIGEIGLDYHYEGYDRHAQIKLFEQMLQLALALRLPVSLHIREAFVDAFAVLDNFPNLTGVVHSFTGSKKDLKQVLNRGFYVGVNGLVTYTTIPLPPLERILLETDAPFLAPVPYRGSTNQPAYVYDIAQYLASQLCLTPEQIADQTTLNAEHLFSLA